MRLCNSIRNSIRPALALVTCLVAILATMARDGWSAGPQYSILHNFSYGTSDGSDPKGGVAILGSKIYGTTLLWGSGQDGVLYSMNLNGTGYQVLHNFSGPDGNQPEADLVVAGSKLYGMAQFGALGGGAGNGTIFSYNSSNASFQTVYQFNGAFTDAATPMAGFTAVGSSLYAATWEGGSYNGGTIIKMGSSGTGYSMVASLGGFGTPQPGSTPESDLIQVGSKLYGTTDSGGAYDQGTIFSLDLSTSALSYLYSFGAAANDGSQPHGNLALVGGKLYGITSSGGSANDGVLFSYNTASSTYSLLHDFAGGTADGADPTGGLVLVDSLLYGTASSGGGAGDGVVYSFDPVTDNLGIVHSFLGSPSDGQDPQSDLTVLGNTIYGTTYDGGANYAGTAFSIVVPEPGTLPLLGVGSMALFCVWRRRTQAAHAVGSPRRR